MARRWCARAAVTGLLGASLTVPLTAPQAPPAAAVDVTVGGTVYADFNGDGTFTGNDEDEQGSTFLDIGVPGVTVTVTDAIGGSATTTSGEDGSWQITTGVLDAFSADLRVEFTDLPTVASETGFQGAENRTSVQFVQNGDMGVDYAALEPDDYSQPEPWLATVIQHAGAPDYTGEGSDAGEPSLVATPWDVAPNPGDPPSFAARTTLATFGETGSLWGAAYSRHRNDYLTSAIYKRLSGLGPLGLGGIYRVPDVLQPDGSLTASPQGADAWFSVEDLGIDVGGPIAECEGLDPGDPQYESLRCGERALTNEQRRVGDPRAASRDTSGFELAERVGIGGITVDDFADRSTLYFVNLFDRQAYGIDLPDPGSDDPPAGTPTAIPLGLGENQVPWAIRAEHGYLYVGYVDTGTTPGQPASSAGMRAHVIRAPIGGSAFEEVLFDSDGEAGLDLGYTRANPLNAVNCRVAAGAPVQSCPAAHPQIVRWNTWTDVWRWGTGPNDTVGLYHPEGWSSSLQLYPQPLVSSISFSAHGVMSIGLADRSKTQSGNRNRAAGDADDSALYETVSSGDMLAAGRQADGTYVAENDGQVAATSEFTGQELDLTTTSGSLNEGPGGREFYQDRQGGSFTGPLTRYHLDTPYGVVEHVPGAREVAATVADPLDQVRVGGIAWFDKLDGDPTRGYTQQRDWCAQAVGLACQQPGPEFQKGGGLGDIDTLTLMAPLEIGNRVWFDGDQDGFQDADEPPVSGVTVQMLQDGEVLGETVTDDVGEYYFSTNVNDEAHYVAGFTPNGGDYTIRFVKPTDGSLDVEPGDDADPFGTIPWSEISFTEQMAGVPTGQTPPPADEATARSCSAPSPRPVSNAWTPTRT